MQRANAYAALAERLERLSKLPSPQLVQHVGARPVVQTVQVANEELNLEFLVTWENKEQSAVRIEGTARGPSSWRLEYLRESITVPVASASSKSTKGTVGSGRHHEVASRNPDA